MTVSRLALWPSLLLSACVTINIYFPAAAAEKAADVIIQEILDAEGTTDLPAPQADRGMTLPLWAARLQPAVDWLIPAATAAQADLNVETAAIKSIRASMKKRFAQLRHYFDSGALGYTADGLVAPRNLSALPLSQRAKLNPLIAAENRDRNALYNEIARANNHPEWEAQIRSTFAARWISNAASGWWYQTDSGWQQK